MNLQDALLLARHIDRNLPGFDVVAVGRFVMVPVWTDETPWKIRVWSDRLQKVCVVESDAAMRLLVERVHEQSQRELGMLF